MTQNDTTVVTEATWKPGLPPPIEALQAKFPPEQGHTVEYGTWLERDQTGRCRCPGTTATAGRRWARPC